MTPRRILFQISGSIAAYKACSVISALVQQGHELQCVATRSGLEFVGEATLEGLTGRPVFTDTFEPGRRMDHIHLAKWAELAVLCPASAGALNRLSAGLADDAIGTLFLAWELGRKPYFVAPAMNQQMWRHPATQASLARLEGWGVRVLPTAEGHQACGDQGPGRLLEPQEILARLTDVFGGLPS